MKWVISCHYLFVRSMVIAAKSLQKPYVPLYRCHLKTLTLSLCCNHKHSCTIHIQLLSLPNHSPHLFNIQISHENKPSKLSMSQWHVNVQYFTIPREDLTYFPNSILTFTPLVNPENNLSTHRVPNYCSLNNLSLSISHLFLTYLAHLGSS